MAERVLAWRLCRAGFADLEGVGARRYGGRWNGPGRLIVYAASDAALAVLEVRVHLDLAPWLIPDDYALLTIELGNVAIETLDEMPDSPEAFGNAWLDGGRTAALKVPSAIVPESPNILLNPRHADATAFRIVRQRHFDFDRRLWSVRRSIGRQHDH